MIDVRWTPDDELDASAADLEWAYQEYTGGYENDLNYHLDETNGEIEIWNVTRDFMDFLVGECGGSYRPFDHGWDE